MGDAPGTGFHPGVRGETAHDAAQRARAAGTDRMLREAEVAVAKHASIDGGILVGGAARVARRFKTMMTMSISDRVLQLESLHADASAAPDEVDDEASACPRFAGPAPPAWTGSSGAWPW